MSRLALASAGLTVLLAIPLVVSPPEGSEGLFFPPTAPTVEAAAVGPAHAEASSVVGPAASLALEVFGAVTPAAAHALSSQARDLRSCFSSALVRHPDLSGTVTVSLVVSEDGHIDGEIEVDEVGDGAFHSCANDAIASWVMPPAAADALRFEARFAAAG